MTLLADRLTNGNKFYAFETSGSYLQVFTL